MEREEFQGKGAWRAGRTLLSTTLRHVKARWALLAIEGKDASRHAGVTALLGLAALFSLVVAYLFLALTVGFFIAWLCQAIGGVWVLVMLGTAVFHLALVAGFGLSIKKRIKAPLFPMSRVELKKDFA